MEQMEDKEDKVTVPEMLETEETEVQVATVVKEFNNSGLD